MHAATRAPDDEARVRALRELAVLDTPADPAADDLVRVAAFVCGAPMSSLMLVDTDREWCMAAVGLPRGVSLPRTASVCDRVIASRAPVIVPDAAADPRFAAHPLVAGAPFLRFYAGVPLTVGGHVLGALCVLDAEPRTLGDDRLAMLEALGRQAALHLAMRHELRELERARQRLELADRMKDDFVAMMTHEVRTPLSSVRGYLEVLIDAGDLSRHQLDRFLGAIDRNSRRLLRMVDDVMLLSQVGGAGGTALSLRRGEVDLLSVADCAIASVAPVASAKGVTLHVARRDAVRVSADGARLREALAHLLGNAVKFTPSGGEVAVEVSDADPPEIRIRDTGIGIPAHEQPMLFERFFRGAAARDSESAGAGLGLCVTKVILDAHAAKISLASEAGKGTDIRITFPGT
ncbi:GAF domain-containing sensor histidine kinase [Catenuloplanes atrovinosus]|uniref:histidine kinase n=1 Tax=Catenuloplanes atrovinosus TaxID=137266 RepID=A0AAE3YTI1_9ACTN|nr:GAF domain-containing sensor histidine kinase [Catenuloplanes atrovinosus]MDR7279638.1 signal transduction histidine kinase [Catenuloplanes atrovinosus]